MPCSAQSLEVQVQNRNKDIITEVEQGATSSCISLFSEKVCKNIIINMCPLWSLIFNLYVIHLKEVKSCDRLSFVISLGYINFQNQNLIVETLIIYVLTGFNSKIRMVGVILNQHPEDMEWPISALFSKFAYIECDRLWWFKIFTVILHGWKFDESTKPFCKCMWNDGGYILSRTCRGVWSHLILT